jgi:hypothetical protein
VAKILRVSDFKIGKGQGMLSFSRYSSMLTRVTKHSTLEQAGFFSRHTVAAAPPWPGCDPQPH